MPIRTPAPITAARLNALQDRTLDVVKTGLHDPIPVLCDPCRIQKGVDYTNLSPATGAGWIYDGAGGWAYNGGGGGLDDDYAVIPVDVEEGESIVGWRALVYRTIVTPPSGMQIGISVVADGTFPPLAPLTGSVMDAVGPLGEWTWVELILGSPYQVTGESIALDLFGSVSTPGQRFGMGFILIERTP